MSAISSSAYQSAQTDVGQFNKNVSALDKRGEVAADPFLNAGYLANQNRVTSYATGQRAFCLHPDFSVEGFAQTYHAACTSGT